MKSYISIVDDRRLEIYHSYLLEPVLVPAADIYSVDMEVTIRNLSGFGVRVRCQVKAFFNVVTVAHNRRDADGEYVKSELGVGSQCFDLFEDAVKFAEQLAEMCYKVNVDIVKSRIEE